MKRIITIALVFLWLLNGVAFVSATGTFEKEKTILNQSAIDKDIILTLDDYSITNKKLVLNYTVTSKTINSKDNTVSIIERPDIVIGDKLIHGTAQTHKKISDGKYTGSIEAELPINSPSKFDVKFNTDAILNQGGQWNVDFKVE